MSRRCKSRSTGRQKPYFDLTRRLQGRFQLGGAEYILAPPTPIWRAKVARTAGRRLTASAPGYLTVSLGEPFNDFCYKLDPQESIEAKK